MKVIDLQQRTTKWQQWRNSGVSASEAIVVLGLCGHKTPYRLYTEKKGLTLPDNLDSNPFVQRGISLEVTARQSFEHRHNTLLFPMCAESEEFPFLRASFDGIDDDGKPVELKVPMEVNFREAQQLGTDSKVYKRYYYQVQQQILVAGTDTGYLSFYFNAKEPPLDFLVARDDKVIEELVFNARQFHDCLKRNQPPPTDLARDIFIPDGSEADKWQALAAGYHRLEGMISEHESKLASLAKEQAGIERELLGLMGDYAQAESAGVRINRYVQQGSIDYKAALMALVSVVDPEYLETFRKGSSERTRITVKGEGRATVPFSMDEVLSTKGGDFWF